MCGDMLDSESSLLAKRPCVGVRRSRPQRGMIFNEWMFRSVWCLATPTSVAVSATICQLIIRRLLMSVAENGYGGVQINPRWATNIYYNVSKTYFSIDVVASFGRVLIIPSANFRHVLCSNGLIHLLEKVTGMIYWPLRKQRRLVISLVSIMMLSCFIKPI